MLLTMALKGTKKSLNYNNVMWSSMLCLLQILSCIAIIMTVCQYQMV